MRVSFLLGDLNPETRPSHPTSTYTYRMTTASRVCGGEPNKLLV